MRDTIDVLGVKIDNISFGYALEKSQANGQNRRDVYDFYA